MRKTQPQTDRYGDNWTPAFLYLAHTATGGRCCWCLSADSKEIHHAVYEDSRGPIVDREIVGRHVFPVCSDCHDKGNPKGVHAPANWIKGRGNQNRNTIGAIDRLKTGYAILSNH
jgi:hypothetical protein